MDIERYIKDNLSDLERRRRSGCEVTNRLLELYQMKCSWMQCDSMTDMLLARVFREYTERFGGVHG